MVEEEVMFDLKGDNEKKYNRKRKKGKILKHEKKISKQKYKRESNKQWS